MLIASIVSLAFLVTPSLAFPWQPGSCNSPQPFGNAHLHDGVYDGGGPLSDFGIEVLIDGEALVLGETFELPVDQELGIELKATAGRYKGYLMKLRKDGLDTRGWLISDSFDVRDNLDDCEEQSSASLSHTDDDRKTSVTGTILIDSETAVSDLILEVTVAIRNDDDGNPGDSEWYQSAFSLAGTASAPPPPPTTIAATTTAATTPAVTTAAATTAAATTPAVTTAAATTIAATTIAVTTVTSPDSGDWYDFLENKFVGANLRSCHKRNGVPPTPGNSCSKKPKTCFFGSQDCSAMSPFPDTRCFCDGNVWSCTTADCPVSLTDQYE